MAQHGLDNPLSSQQANLPLKDAALPPKQECENHNTPPSSKQVEALQPLDGLLYGSLRVHLALGLSSSPHLSDADWGLPCVAPEYVPRDGDESRFREALKRDYTVEQLRKLFIARCRSSFKKSVMQRRACQKRAEIDRKISGSLVELG